MNNYEIHDLASEMAESHSAYKLAREVLKLRETVAGLEAERDALTVRCEQLQDAIEKVFGNSKSNA